MTALIEYFPDGTPLHGRTEDFPAISFALSDLGIILSRWTAADLVASQASDDEILNAYRWDIQKLIRKRGYKFADVVSLDEHTPDVKEIHDKFNREHVHQDDEARFFIEGGGVFYFHVEERILGLECGPGDFIYFPAGTRHWFDMGQLPRCRCVRMFMESDGWVPEYTGSNIALSFPAYPGPGKT